MQSYSRKGLVAAEDFIDQSAYEPMRVVGREYAIDQGQQNVSLETRTILTPELLGVVEDLKKTCINARAA